MPSKLEQIHVYRVQHFPHNVLTIPSHLPVAGKIQKRRDSRINGKPSLEDCTKKLKDYSWKGKLKQRYNTDASNRGKSKIRKFLKG